MKKPTKKKARALPQRGESPYLGALRKAMQPKDKQKQAAAVRAELKRLSRDAGKALACGDMKWAISRATLGSYLLGKLHLLEGHTEDPGSEIFSSVEEAELHDVLGRTAEASQVATDRSIRELQATLPWTVHYHRDFRASPMTHKDFAHALLHVHKAAGKLSALVNDAEHGGCEFTAEQTDPYVADLVVCALRMANTCPGRTIDLQRAVVERIENKNNMRLPRRRR